MKSRTRREPRPLVRVVNLHGTPARDRERFRRQVEWVCRHFTPVNAQALSSLWETGTEPVPKGEKPWVLFTFDDGLASNYHIAAPVLESMNATGLFFVVPGFSQCKDDEARSFYYHRLMGVSGSSLVDSAPEEWTPMSPEQIAELASRGHDIGNHTFSHSRLNRVPVSELHKEIVESARVIRQWTSKDVDTFT